ncbi:MAG: cysteine hydrolase [Gammaproteobacteria bacterium]|nr:cysteine hydrolase [Gammaproteobacteria bacterium]
MSDYINQFTRPVPIAADHTALVVIDMQYASGSRSHGLGAHLARQGTLDDADYRFSRIEKLIIPNTQKLLTAFRAAKAPVIYVTVGARNADLSDAPAHLRSFFEVCNNHAGSFENGIVAELAPMPGEPIVAKNTMGAFASSDLGAVFDRLGVKTAVYVGVSTNNCVDTTAREAADRNYGSILVSDATGTCSDRMQEVTLESFRRLWGRVLTTDEVLGELQASARQPAHA